ncbi:hypothetical protein [Sinorhizobium saheli]|uniref:hypothetical protein n=1 Tax=Sinorhizobium saheli TaxID=36856 RepID=UPI001F3E8D66|nr:hypothetical protein [Sinorhizobium saheli]
MSAPIFDQYRTALTLRPLSSVWRGHGSAIFLEFGRLSPESRRDGSAGNPRGEYTVMIEWSWRIEGENSIICGSWSDEQDWDGAFKSLVGRQVQDISLYGRLPELSIQLSGGIYVASFMTAGGQPAWAIICNAPEGRQTRFISVENGGVIEGVDYGSARR